MDKIIQILKELNATFKIRKNSVEINSIKRIHVVGNNVYFSYAKSESKLSLNNPMLKSWIRNYIGG